MSDESPIHGIGDPFSSADGADPGELTTNAGEPVPDDQNSRSAGLGGPLLMDDYPEKMAQCNRERIPERVVHAKGGGSRTFTVTIDEISGVAR